MTNPLRSLVLATLLLWSCFAHAWWNAEWASRRQIAIDAGITGAALTSTLNDVPVLVRLHAGNLNGLGKLAANGEELRFLIGDSAPASYHIEKFDAALEQALVWIKLPRLSGDAQADSVWMYYGNAQAKPASDAAKTYDVAQALVLHFNDVAGALPRDVTAYGNHAVESSAKPLPVGWLGSAVEFDGAARIAVKASPSLALDPAKGWTFSAWLKVDAAQEDGVVFEAVDGAQRLSLRVIKDGLVAAYGATRTASASLTPGKWQHVALTVGDGKLTLYVDGNEVAHAAVSVAALSPAVTLGADSQGHFLKGALDEVGIASVARSADWLKFLARSQSPDFAVTDFGTEEKADAVAGKSAGHFAVIIQNVFGRPDAIVEQSVIGVCALMAAIALLVMFVKAVYLGRCRRATRRFLAAYFDRSGGTVGALEALADAEDEYGAAPVFRVYTAGLGEIRARVGDAAGDDFKPLEDRSIDAIRARLDAVMVRESQQLNGLLVLLTIAISGGPFIGLLGTVVGVMVTFAAIAATGDVNIAAIAPGMAAALLATVAGLGVAIPSLFGYNYLSAKAKDINADMHVFADEFLARVSEQYRR